jgi:hypothetical protein
MTESNKMSERQRIINLLLDEIDTKQLMVERWEALEGMPEDVKRDNIKGFAIEKQALILFMMKAFGFPEEYILKCVKEKFHAT